MLLLIGLIIGLVLGLTGAGGSVFAVPLLMLLGGLPMNEAVGISLGAVAASTLYGSLRNWRGKQILWLPGMVLAISGALAAPLGQWLGQRIPSAWLLSGFSVLALVIAVRMWLSAKQSPNHARHVRAGNFSHEPNAGLLCTLSKTGQFELRPRCLSGLVVGGLVVGVLSGLFGVGGGFLIIPLLLALSAITMAQAVSTSLVIIAAVSSSGFVGHLLIAPHYDWQALALVAVGGVMGMMLGQLLSHKIANASLQKIFALCLMVISVITLVMHH